MERSSIKLAAAALLITAMLAGCGAKDEAAPASNNGQAASGTVSGGSTANTANGGGASQAPDRTADIMAKIIKVTADSIVIQESKTAPSDMQRKGGFGSGRQRGNGGNQGERPAGQVSGGTGDQQPSSGNGDRQQQPSAANGGGKGGRARGFQMEFKDEQTTLSIHADTQIVSLIRGQDGMTTEQLKAADLKEGDIVTIWLNDTDKTAVQYMTLRNIPANFGKAGNQ